MIGQDKLVNIINNTPITRFPHSVILIGEEGSGRHMLCNQISEKFNLPITDITEMVSLETIESINAKVESGLYIVDLDDPKIQIKEQNVILKFIEEPRPTVFVVLLCENTNSILPTVVGRCQNWYLNNYKEDDLKQFNKSGNELILKLAHTPGQVISMQDSNINMMYSFAEKVMDKMHVANYANALSISNKLAFKDEKDKFNVNIFVKCLVFASRQQCIYNRVHNCYAMYNETMEFCKRLKIKNSDKKYLFENYLSRLWTISRQP